MATRTRRSGLDRVCEYFEVVSAREAEAAFMLVSKIMAERTGETPKRRRRATETEAQTADQDHVTADDGDSPIAAARAKRAAAAVS
jgi:hypothetical protein